ncbi:MAG: glycosyl transferase family 2 [Candidatus Tectimicrobiota bacterium]|nr:MAG: glycosyl transferase family 2 [Candidatus Tectomicrobia bacterium]
MREGLRVSVIVPTLNEAAYLPATLARVGLAPQDELIVVDGGSDDGTVAVAQRFTSQVLVTSPGRARQMNAGAQRAQGDVLLFLHADTLLPPDGVALVRAAMQPPEVVGGAFALAIVPATPALRLVAWGANWRTRLARLPYGDQALFVRRQVFVELGGYADWPFLEDVQLVRALRRRGRLAFIAQPVCTSARRWQREGVLYTTLRNLALITLFFCGVSPHVLKRWYASAPR